MRSFTEYLNRPGHVLLPDGMIIAEEFEMERNNPLLRVRMLWKYWHGTWGLPASGPKHVSCQGHSSLDAPSELNPPQRIPSPLFVALLAPQAKG